jgi:hypothetical protein
VAVWPERRTRAERSCSPFGCLLAPKAPYVITLTPHPSKDHHTSTAPTHPQPGKRTGASPGLRHLHHILLKRNCRRRTHPQDCSHRATSYIMSSTARRKSFSSINFHSINLTIHSASTSGKRAAYARGDDENSKRSHSKKDSKPVRILLTDL